MPKFKKYHFNYVSMTINEIMNHIYLKYSKIQSYQVVLSQDDVLLLLRQLKGRGLTTEEYQATFDRYSRLYNLPKLHVCSRAICSALSKAYLTGILDKSNANNQRYVFPVGIPLDGTAAQADKEARWRVGIERRKVKAYVSISGANKRLDGLRGEEDDYNKLVASKITGQTVIP